MHDWKSKELAKHLAILTQSNNIQMKLTVEELVAFGRFPHSGGRLNDKDKDIINKSIEYMELNEFRNRFIDELSGGQRQRAYIAMVIAQDTEFILLDEPTNNLDIYHATNLMKIIRKLSDELGKQLSQFYMRLIMQHFILIIYVHLKTAGLPNLAQLMRL